MVNKINPLINLNSQLGAPTKTHTNNDISFSNILKDAIGNVNKLELEADNLTLKMAAGEIDNIHEVMIATQKAEISMRLLVEVRNKVLDAYREITRMQI